MKVLVFAHGLRAGGGRATCTNILAALTNIDKDNVYYFVVPDQAEYRALELDNGKHIVHYYRRRCGHLGRWFFDTFTLKQIVRRFQPDVIWGIGNLCLTSPPCPQAISIQNPYLFYDVKNTGRLSLTNQLWLFFLKRQFKRQLPATSLVFCQTATMENRLRSLWGYNGKAKVTSKVVSAFSTLKPADGEMPAPLICCKKKYKIFYLARYYPHKGLEMLVEVMDKYRDELADAVAVITIEAGQHKNAARLLKQIKERGLDDRVINVGPLRQEQLADYYAACDCLVMPTKLESFSGTYLESMHFGLPILTSDLDFAHEVCRDAALYFDPWDAESVKDAILRIKNDPELKCALVEKGRARLSERFGRTWEDIATETRDNLESLVAGEQN